MPVVDPVKNFASAIVSGKHTQYETTIYLYPGEGSKLPDPATDGAYNLTWWNATDYLRAEDDADREIIRVTAKSGDKLTASRGQESTTAKDHIGDKVYKLERYFTALDLSKFNAGIGVKIGTITRDLTAASETVDYTGFGFTPVEILFIGAIHGGSSFCVAHCNSSACGRASYDLTTYKVSDSTAIKAVSTAGNYQEATAQIIPNGVRLSWTKAGSPTGTATIYYLARK